jgi:hypothetical protein
MMSLDPDMTLDTSELRTFKQFASENPAFSMGKLKYWWKLRKRNGIAEIGAMVMINNRKYVHKMRMNWWVMENIKE